MAMHRRHTESRSTTNPPTLICMFLVSHLLLLLPIANSGTPPFVFTYSFREHCFLAGFKWLPITLRHRLWIKNKYEVLSELFNKRWNIGLSSSTTLLFVQEHRLHEFWYVEAELNMGVNSCIDRCVSKYWHVTNLIGLLLGSPSNVYNLYGGRVRMNATAPPPSSAMDGIHRHKMMMHMTFFWGKNGEILFPHWPGTRTGMYVLALVLVFFLSLLSEWLPRCTFLKPGSKGVASGLAQTLLHGFRVGLCYMVMLAVMSFNGGVFLVAIAGHTLGFFLFGSRVLQRSNSDEKSSDHSIC